MFFSLSTLDYFGIQICAKELGLHFVFTIGSYGGLSFEGPADHQGQNQLLFSRPGKESYLATVGECKQMVNSGRSTVARVFLSGYGFTVLVAKVGVVLQTRMVNPCPTEQNYSIFYQLLAGLSPDERGEEIICSISRYRYINSLFLPPSFLLLYSPSFTSTPSPPISPLPHSHPLFCSLTSFAALVSFSLLPNLLSLPTPQPNFS